MRTASFCTRSYCFLRGTKISAGDLSFSLSTRRCPRNPEPPVTTTRLLSQKLMCLMTRDTVDPRRLGFQICINHHSHKLAEIDPRPPPEFLASFGGVAEEEIHFCRSEIPFVDLHIFRPLEIDVTEGFIEE